MRTAFSVLDKSTRGGFAVSAPEKFQDAAIVIWASPQILMGRLQCKVVGFHGGALKGERVNDGREGERRT